jgi:site-specific DNA recombinase
MMDTVARPALERLRDVAAAGGMDHLYVHCPDRFARNYAYQVLLLDELNRQGVEVIFLNRPLGQTPEDQLLLQVQGVIAEYERAKFLERSRRGKRHAAQEGRVGILCHAPYGYRYVNKQEGGGEARFEMVFDEARTVQQVFAWVGQERCTINEVCRRLYQAGTRTQTGKEHWDHKTIWDLLKNPAYKGEAAFGKTRWMPVGPRRLPPRGRPVQSRRGYAGNDARHPTSGLPSLCQRWWMQPYSMPCKSSWKRTGGEHVFLRRVLATYCRACSCVPDAGLLIVGAPMMHAMPITAVQER